jgi:hypothetical protein
MLGILIPFGITFFFPFLGVVGLIGFTFIKYALPVMIIRWWIKYGGIKTTDPEFSTARIMVILVTAASVLVLLFLHVHLFAFTV